jgi:riboflavin synthase
MFTGIVQALGRVTGWERKSQGARLCLTSPDLDMSKISRGESIAVSGVCLTVTDIQANVLGMDVSSETLARSTLRYVRLGAEINLETALTPVSRFGGHLVSGHVDGIGEIASREQSGDSVQLTIATPPRLARYIAEKGSICVDGVSLTVNGIAGADFNVMIIPHTLQVTTLKHLTPGSRVNIEVDLVARYLERLMLGASAADANDPGITQDLLVRYGFLNDP